MKTQTLAFSLSPLPGLPSTEWRPNFVSPFPSFEQESEQPTRREGPLAYPPSLPPPPRGPRPAHFARSIAADTTAPSSGLLSSVRWVSQFKLSLFRATGWINGSPAETLREGALDRFSDFGARVMSIRRCLGKKTSSHLHNE